VDLALKNESEKNFDVIGLIVQAFGENLTSILDLPRPPFEEILVFAVMSNTPTTAPSAAPTDVPNVVSSTETPSNSSSFMPTGGVTKGYCSTSGHQGQPLVGGFCVICSVLISNHMQ